MGSGVGFAVGSGAGGVDGTVGMRVGCVVGAAVGGAVERCVGTGLAGSGVPVASGVTLAAGASVAGARDGGADARGAAAFVTSATRAATRATSITFFESSGRRVTRCSDALPVATGCERKIRFRTSGGIAVAGAPAPERIAVRGCGVGTATGATTRGRVAPMGRRSAVIATVSPLGVSAAKPLDGESARIAKNAPTTTCTMTERTYDAT